MEVMNNMIAYFLTTKEMARAKSLVKDSDKMLAVRHETLSAIMKEYKHKVGCSY